MEGSVNVRAGLARVTEATTSSQAEPLRCLVDEPGAAGPVLAGSLPSPAGTSSVPPALEGAGGTDSSVLARGVNHLGQGRGPVHALSPHLSGAVGARPWCRARTVSFLSRALGP